MGAMGEWRTVAILGGTGWMGGAMARHGLERGVLDEAGLWLTNRSGAPGRFADRPAVRITTDNAAAAAACRTVVLSVPPDDFPGLGLDLSGKLVISVMAGVGARRIADETGAAAIVRAMPNPPAEIGRSWTPWWASAATGPAARQAAAAFLGGFGAAREVGSEELIGYFTALTGSGTGFVAFFADAMIRHATARGLDDDLATEAVAGLFDGSGAMFAAMDRSPAALVRELVDYDGTTAAGLRLLLASPVASHVGEAIDAAHARATWQPVCSRKC